MKKIGIIGVSGSIGKQAVRIIDMFGEMASLCFASVHRNIDYAKFLLNTYPDINGIAVTSEEMPISDLGSGKVFRGKSGLKHLIESSRPDLIIFAVPGSSMIDIFLFILERGIRVASANKEVFTSAGSLISPYIKAGMVLPVDSEQSAIFQALQSGGRDEISRIILTCSGGPFLGKSSRDLKGICPEDALTHPKWNMGQKVTLDSATLMNKALELIEASVLFDVPHSRIDVLVHPEVFVHSMVEFCDGNIIMQAGKADMSVPIQYAISYPERWNNNGNKIKKFPKGMTFFDVDYETFTSIPTARRALDKGGSALTVFDYANELMGRLFLEGKTGFLDIMNVVNLLVEKHRPMPIKTVQDVYNARHWVCREIDSIVKL